jgi:signal transduction histidine kinase
MNVDSENESSPRRAEEWTRSEISGNSTRRCFQPTRRSDAASLAQRSPQDGPSLNCLFGLVAHELSTPLTTIAVATGVLRATAGEDRGLLDMMNTQIRRLQSVVADLLDVSRLDHGEMRPRSESFVVFDAVSDALRCLGDEMPADWVTLSGPVAATRVRADRVFVERIVVNLLRNAALHGAPPIEIDIASDAEVVSIAVRDHGPGLADLAVASLFQPYRSYGAAGRLGLGLALSRAFARAVGGELLLAGTSPTCFVLTLPVDPVVAL